MADPQSKPATTQQPATISTNVLGGDTFDPAKWLVVPARTFEDLKVGDVFRALSRTLTQAYTFAFQAVSLDNHPRHYNDEHSKSHGLSSALVQPIEVLAFSAPGASLFTHAIGEAMVVLTGTPCTYVKDSL